MGAYSYLSPETQLYRLGRLSLQTHTRTSSVPSSFELIPTLKSRSWVDDITGDKRAAA